MTDNQDYNDLWNLDRQDYVAIVTEARSEISRLRAELDADPTATLRQQLAGSQSALSKVMGELTEARAELEQARADVRGLRNDRDMWRDAAYQAADVSAELERSRRTNRRLVVTARAMWDVMMFQQRTTKRYKRSRIIATIQEIDFQREQQAERGQE